MRELNIMLARSYLNLISVRSKDEKHTEQIINALDQLIYLEEWRSKAIKMINEKEQKLIKQGSEVINYKSELSSLLNELDGLERQNTEQQSVIERLTENKTKNF